MLAHIPIDSFTSDLCNDLEFTVAEIIDLHKNESRNGGSCYAGFGPPVDSVTQLVIKKLCNLFLFINLLSAKYA